MNKFRKDEVQDIYYLSPMQEGMLFHGLKDREKGFYVEQMAIKTRGILRIDFLEQSVRALIDRHDILRTVFVHEKVKRPVQVVLRKRNFAVRHIDLRSLSHNEQLSYIDDLKHAEKERGFDLTRDILMRMTVFQTGDDTYEWIWTYHHILFDGWCLGIVIRELLEIYLSICKNKDHTLPLPKPYKDYIQWLAVRDKESSLEYWAKYLSGFSGQSTFVQQRNRSGVDDYRQEECCFQLCEADTRLLSQFAAGQGVTIGTAIQSAWSVLLGRYQGANDIIFGTIVSGRPAELPGAEQMVGLFINVIPTRVQLTDGMSFQELARKLQKQSIQSEAHQYIPIYEIQSHTSHHELIDHIVVFENYPVEKLNGSETGTESGFTVEEVNIYEKPSFDFSLVASPGNEITMKISYNANIYDSEFVDRISRQFLTLIHEVTQSPQKSLGEISIVPAKEKELLLSEFNPSVAEEPNTKTLVQWFEQQVVNFPEKIALSSGREHLTYQTLNERANQLAHVLHAKGVRQETIVALIADRSSLMVIAILAILKAGGAYLPIDPVYPTERIQYMLEDSKAHFLLSKNGMGALAENAGFTGEILTIDDPAYRSERYQNLNVSRAADDLAYIIYTSGTTGQPKGTLITHKNVTRVVKNTNYLEIVPVDTILSLSNYAFDGFTFDLFGALTNGARLVVAQKETILDTSRLRQLIQSEGITVMFITTALFNLLIDTGGNWTDGIRKILFGGERSSVNHVRKALKTLGPGKIIHVYGPTEATVFATFYPVDDIPSDTTSIPIGRPLNQTSAYILSPSNQLQPIGVVGELFLGGAGLARGYLNQPRLTTSRFVENPYMSGRRIYRTGDLARWLPDGNIEFVGRTDDQVKIRGHRIELGEVEHALLKHGAVKEAIVQAVQNSRGGMTLCAYLVAERNSTLTSGQLRSWLSETLPGYMVPSAYVLLECMPLTANGKVDRRHLPEAPSETLESRNITEPRNDLEFLLAKIWCKFLDIDRIGIYENFFNMGGHSLSAMALCAEMTKMFTMEISIGRLFELPTIAEISGYIQCQRARHEENENSHIQQTSPGAKLEVTCFNPNAGKNVFAFPPVLGYGIIFGELAKELPEYRVHAFDFIEANDRILRYVTMIQQFQPTDSLILLGYSAGCSLAFEVAKELEKQGRTVDGLIMIDSYRKIAKSDLNGRSIEADVQALLNANKDNFYLQNEEIRSGFAEKLKASYKYYVELVNSGRVNAPIHLIKSETNIPLPKELLSWDGVTKSCHSYQGHGLHDEMLSNSYAKLNAGFILDILMKTSNGAYVC